MFYAQPLEGSLIFHQVNLQTLVPVHFPCRPSCPAASVMNPGFEKGWESGLGIDMQLRAFLCLPFESRCFERKHTGLGAIK